MVPMLIVPLQLWSMTRFLSPGMGWVTVYLTVPSSPFRFRVVPNQEKKIVPNLELGKLSHAIQAKDN